MSPGRSVTTLGVSHARLERDVADVVADVAPALKLRWFNDGERHGESWLAVDEWADPVATVSPVRGPATRSSSPPDQFVAIDGQGNEVGRARTRAAAQRLVLGTRRSMRSRAP